MSYRKITVDGKVYEYTVGKTHTKIRGIGVWKNEEIGNNHTTWTDPICECCGESFSSLYGQAPTSRTAIAVKPHDIMKKVRILTPELTFAVLKGLKV